MHIASSNLDDRVLQSVHDDLATVLKLAPARGIELPARELHLVSLEESRIPDSLPDHAVIPASQEIPVSYVARCAWEKQRQGFELIVRDEQVWIIGGGNAGALYGAGETLRCLTGIVWAGLYEDDFLFGPTLPIPTGIQTPLMAFRGRDGSGPDDELMPYLRWLGRNRYNLWRRGSSSWAKYPEETRQAILRHFQARSMHLTLGCHAMEYFLPEEEFAAHPDWLGLRDGVRQRKAMVSIPECPNLDAELPIQPCYSNAALAEQITDRMAADMHANPQALAFALWPHDGVNNWCQCERCLPKTPYEHMYDLAMRLETKLSPTIPIELIAYSNLLNVPRHPLPCSERTVTTLCPYLRHYTHHVYDDGGPELTTGNRYPEPDRINPVDDREYGELFRLWRDACRASGSALAIYEYGAQFYDETRRIDRPRYLYHPPAKLLDEEMAWYAGQGVQTFHMCTIFRGWPDNFHEIALARSMWKTGEVESVRADYYSAIALDSAHALMAALQALERSLLAETLGSELQPLVEALAGGPEPFAERYQLWSRYVALGRESRECELSGDYDTAIALEKQIQELIAAHEETLRPIVLCRYIRHLSDIAEQRLIERSQARKGSGYML